MWVVKLGGSLQDSRHLKSWLDSILTHGKGRVVLVPGGGRFADKVRRDQERRGFGDAEAHVRALNAMEEYAAFLCTHCPQLVPVQSRESIRQALDNKQIPVWLPSAMVVGSRDLPASWDVTSDSLALWLAQQLLSKGLILIKSVAVDASRSSAELAQAGVIDAFFPRLLSRKTVNLVWCVRDQYGQLPALLERR